jgi:hypothetical protein
MTSEAELRTTSDSFLSRLSKLGELESLKRTLTPGTPEMIRVSLEVENLSREVLRVAMRQSELAEAARKQDSATVRPIAVIPPRDMTVILADWREAERGLGGATPGTAEWEAALADVERLRDEYRRAFEARKE